MGLNLQIARLARGIYARAARTLPAPLAGTLDGLIRFEQNWWGTAFNGQAGRDLMFAELVERLAPNVIIETGTFRGTTTARLRALSTAPVYSVEVNKRCYYSARWRFRGDPRVTLLLGDSRNQLRALASDRGVPKEGALFYLDAHWNTDLPLVEELQIVASEWKSSVVVVDDFRVDDDPGFGFDDYGEGQGLTLEAIAKCEGHFEPYWPSVNSADETGARRGSVLLAQAGALDRIGSMSTIRKARSTRMVPG